MMKSLILYCLLSLLLTNIAIAQGEFPSSYGRNDRFTFKEADFAYYQGDYGFALDLFSDLYSIDTLFGPINHRIGACSLKLRKGANIAIPYLEQAVKSNYSEAWFEYGEALHLNGELKAARNAFEKYLAEGGIDHSPEEIDQKLRMINYAEEAMRSTVDVSVKNLGPDVNSAFDDYVPVVTADEKRMYFTSRRSGSTAQLKDPEGNFFEDIYASSFVNNQWTEVLNLGIPMNSETHDATVSISADGNTMIIYRTNENRTGGDLYSAKLSNGKWSKPEKFGKEINSEFQEASACLSSDGQTLIFSSNRPGGMGGKDLYRVKKLPNGVWSLPRNLGPSINTPFDEDSPILSNEDQTMYFASNGHNSIGGFDLFKVEADENGNWKSPRNLGYPINTTADDLYLCITANGQRGYYNSAKKGGFGGQDLYSIEFIYRDYKNIAVRGKVIDEDGEAIQAKLTVMDQRLKKLNGEYRSKLSNGSFALILNPITPYKVMVEADGYKATSFELEIPMTQADFSEHDIKPIILFKE